MVLTTVVGPLIVMVILVVETNHWTSIYTGVDNIMGEFSGKEGKREMNF